MIKKKSKLYVILYGIILFILSFFAIFENLHINRASAVSVDSYSYVLDDLKKDSNFYVEDYPFKEGDNTLQVITVAESSNDELFLYVYQPSSKYIATHIKMYANNVNELSYSLYGLTHLSSSGVFQKYKVTDFKLPDRKERIYEIVSIFRPFDINVDDKPSNSNQTISEIDFRVAKRFVIGIDGINSNPIDVIEVTDKYVGFSRFKQGYTPETGKDIHFVAFSTDLVMDDILEIEVAYQQQHYSYKYHTNGQGGVFVDSETYGVIEDKKVLIKKGENFYWNERGGFWGNEITENSFPVILKTDEFIKSEDFSKTYQSGIFNVTNFSVLDKKAKEEISSKTWVVRFAETNYYDNYQSGKDTSKADGYWDFVSNVTILRLMFETDGNIFNLGVVDSMQTGSSDPSNKQGSYSELLDSIKILAVIVIVGIVLYFGWSFISPILFWLIIGLFKILIFILLLPIKAIKALFKRKRK